LAHLQRDTAVMARTRKSRTAGEQRGHRIKKTLEIDPFQAGKSLRS
jgi:hypothetical protein